MVWVLQQTQKNWNSFIKNHPQKNIKKKVSDIVWNQKIPYLCDVIKKK